MLQLSSAGIEAFDVHTKRGAFAGIISKQKTGVWKVYFNTTATKCSARKFATGADALQFIYDRRAKKGWTA